MQSKQNGFSLATSIIGLTIILITLIVGWTEYSLWQARQADTHDKTSLNGLQSYLEKIYYAQNSTYPSIITSPMLEILKEEQRVDSDGVPLGSQASRVRYEPTNCLNDACKSYELRALLQNEPDFVKQNDTH